MGDTHWRSNLKGKSGSETISNFSSVTANSFVGDLTGDVTGDITGSVTADSPIKIGSAYIFSGSLNTEASIVAVATAVTATPKGSLYLSTEGNLWLFTGNGTAATVAV